MSLYVFSTLVLSIIAMLLFNSWWIDNAPFKIHLAALIVAASSLFSIFLMITIYPVMRRSSSKKQLKENLDKARWANEVSINLSAPAAVLDGYILVFANRAFLSELGMLGMNDQYFGMPITNIIHPRDHQHLAELFASTAKKSEKKESTKLRLLNLDGSIIKAHISLSPLIEDNSSDLNLLQFASQSSLIEDDFVYVDQSSYQQILNHIEQVVFHLNIDQQIIFLNPSWESMLDYKVQDSLNKSLSSYIHPEDKPIAEARINALIQGKHSKSKIVLRIIGRNGSLHWVELRAKNTTNYKGERSSVIGTLTDISKMKTTEARMLSDRRLLDTIINNVPCMIYRCKNDKNFSFEFVSDGSADVSGYEPHEMIDNPNFSYMHIVHEEDRKMTWDYVQSKVSAQQNFQMIYRIVTRSGSIKWVWEHGTGVFSSNGELLAIEGVVADFAEQDHSAAIFDFRKDIMMKNGNPHAIVDI
ncbi:MAG: PAS domain-containing protein [Methylophilaceae bacterium]